MQQLAVLTIGREQEKDLVKIVEEGRSYFPKETWDTIEHTGNLRFEHDFKIAIDSKSHEGFLFQKMINKIRKIRNSNQPMGLLLGVTSDPIVVMYTSFDRTGFKRAIYLLHDYVDERVGVVSFFQVNKKFSSRLVAHGLGHNRGLQHHLEPIDLMYSELLKSSKLKVDGFCEVCQRKLTEETTDTCVHTH